jgi:hypothetical protein
LPNVVTTIGAVESVTGLVSWSSGNMKQVQTEEPANLEMLKIKELLNELEALQRERDEAKRLARYLLEKDRKLPVFTLEGN